MRSAPYALLGVCSTININHGIDMGLVLAHVILLTPALLARGGRYLFVLKLAMAHARQLGYNESLGTLCALLVLYLCFTPYKTFVILA